MNKKFANYLKENGDDIICNKHLIFLISFMKENTENYGMLYKLSNHIYRCLKNGETKTLNDAIKDIKK